MKNWKPSDGANAQLDELTGSAFGRILEHAKLIWLTLLALTVLGTGCASSIYAQGKYKEVLKEGVNRTTIIARLGEPEERTRDRFYHDFDLFRAKGKIVPGREDLNTYRFMEGMTLGIGDIIWTPIELVRAPFLAAGEKMIGVAFDDNGMYVYHEVHRAKQKPKS